MLAVLLADQDILKKYEICFFLKRKGYVKHVRTGIGYAMGVERVLATMELQGVAVDQRERCDLYIATMGEQAQIEGARILYRMRINGIAAEKDYLGRSLKAQMKNAARLNAPYVLILGDKELQDNVVMLRKMACSEQYEISVDKLEETLFSMIREDKNSE